MEAESIVRKALARSGIDAIHTDSFGEGLALVEAISQETSHLGASRERLIETQCVRSLSSRLRIDDWIARHPDVIDDPVDRPVFVVGMPRTGTTALVNLIGQDERCRVLWNWEMDYPTPPARPEHRRDDPRIAATIARLAPLQKALAHHPHFEQATDPVECVHVLAQDFRSITFQTATGSTRYNDWLLDEADLRPAYRHHRRVLQVLQSGGLGGQWVLKLPSHALHLEALLSVYPDARFVFTHRDPLPALVSMCSYAAMIHQDSGNEVELSEVVAFTRRQVLESALRPIAFRAAHPDVPCFDLFQADLQQDPVGVVGRLYEWIGGLSLSRELAERMQRYLSESWQHAPGTHRYDARDFGIDPAAVDRDFHDYLERHAIAKERR